MLDNCSFEAFGLEEVDASVEDDVLVAAVFLLLEEASERKISDQHIHEIYILLKTKYILIQTSQFV